jgi:hypothetical protein
MTPTAATRVRNLAGMRAAAMSDDGDCRTDSATRSTISACARLAQAGAVVIQLDREVETYAMDIDVTGGTDPSLDGVLATAPENPLCREGENVWVFDDQGRFTLPRVAVEAISGVWMDRGLQGNVGFPGGRVLNDAGAAKGHDHAGVDGTPRVFGAGPLRLECIEPFRHWKIAWHGPMRDTSVDEQLGGRISDRFIDVDFDIDATMVVPPWFQGTMSTEAAAVLQNSVERRFMGNDGTRHEQLFRCTGTFRAGVSAPIEFTGTGLRIHRIGVRDVSDFWGHNWQTAVFPSGRAFAIMTFPPRPDGSPSYAEAFVYDDAKMHPAKIIEVQWLTKIVPDGGDVSVVVETKAHGQIRIGGLTHGSTYSVQGQSIHLDWSHEVAPNACTFSQGGARYEWDGEKAYGMVERSLPDDKIER